MRIDEIASLIGVENAQLMVDRVTVTASQPHTLGAMTGMPCRGGCGGDNGHPGHLVGGPT